MSRPALPLITLVNQRHRVAIADPRPDPRVLGARYVHGGYITEWAVDGRTLTGTPMRSWTPFGGAGLPETFELAVGWAVVPEGHNFLRVGVGQMRKTPWNPGDAGGRPPIAAVLDWMVEQPDERTIVMRTNDSMEIHGSEAGYDLERRVIVHEDGVESVTTMTLAIPRLGSHPMVWFAHPFFRHTQRQQVTALEAPGAQLIPTVGHLREGPGALAKGSDGLWRFGAGHNRSVLGNLWGSRAPFTVHLDPALGGGRVVIALTAPLDHAVVWASDMAFSVEPKLSKTVTDGETVSWSVRYRFAE